MIQISFHGAMATVGSSAVMIDTGVEKIMMDYGTKIRTEPPQFPIPIQGNGKPDVVLLTHAHLDHSGGLAIFEANGSRVPIFSLPVTKPLVEMLLYDSIKISTEEGNKLPFGDGDVDSTIKNFIPVEFKEPHKLKKTTFTYYDAGHIPGAGMIYVEHRDKKILYTGDFHSIDQRLVKKYDQKIPQADIVITESTYAQRDHPDREEQEKQLVEIIRDTMANGGTTLISGFAIGRLQELLLVLHKYGIDYPLYMDGMAKKATTVINQHKHLLADPNKLDEALQKVTYVKSDKMRKAIIKKPCAVLTTSGMLTGGAVVFYLKRLFNNKNSSLLLTGYQLPDTPGKTLLETGRYVAKDLSLDLKMFVKRLDFSAHVGRTGLFDFLKKQNPEKIFCIHGDNTEDFANELKTEHGYDAVAPVANNRFFNV
ncbi:MAG TPA: MBL fold metallo-hydrolase [archaeon]|nr:MBL fold metallo-hydrolase [archaeon]